jgi:hypothetical protein
VDILFVAGSFDDEGGRPSGLMQKLWTFFGKYLDESPLDVALTFINGGYYDQLGALIGINDWEEDPDIEFKMKWQGETSIIREPLTKYDVILWFANVPNDKEKIVEEIKKRHPRHILITSKRNVEKSYDLREIVLRALKIRSNLILEFTARGSINEIVRSDGNYSYRYFTRVLDPLGNIFCEPTEDLQTVAKVLVDRIYELVHFTRVGSKKVADETVEVPDHEEFFEIIKTHGEKFHELIHGVGETTRFLGNASFRCVRGGFPSFRDGECIFVSRRNIDKRCVDRNGFVRVVLDDKNGVEFFGDNKPSVDTPIQKKLYEYYPNVNFMIHGHTYIKDAPKTSVVVPCGAVEEFDEIVKLFPDRESTNFSVNLRGHGSITLAEDIEYLRDIPFIMRNLFEVHELKNSDKDDIV